MKDKRIQPPGVARILLRFFLNHRHLDSVLADYEEIFQSLRIEKGRCSASRWYWLQVLLCIPSFAMNSLYWSGTMIRNTVKIALRHMLKYKGYTIINTMGLAVGLASVILIVLYVHFELSFDRYHEHAESIYRIVAEHPWSFQGKNMSATTPGVFATSMMDEIPEVALACRFWRKQNVLVTHEDRSSIEETFHFTDPECFDMFSLNVLEGDGRTALSNPNSVILSSKMAKKYFGDDDPMGKMIRYQDRHDFYVTGVIEDMPQNSHFRMEFIASLNTAVSLNPWLNLEAFNFSAVQTYIRLEEGASLEELEAKFETFLGKHMTRSDGPSNRYFLQPLKRIHLYSDMISEYGQQGSARVVALLSGIAFLILLVACVNYINLATARSLQRAKEVGVRKTVGARRTHLIRQFYGESGMMAVLSFIFALLSVPMALPFFNTLIKRQLGLGMLGAPAFIVTLAIILIFVIICSGSYPALALSSFRASTVVSGDQKSIGKPRIRSVLVIFQFTVSMLLIMCALLIRSQLQFILNKDTGYTRDRIVVIRMRDRQAREQLEIIKQELLRHPEITAVSSSSSLPNETGSLGSADWPGKPEDMDVDICINWVDYDFIDLFEIDLVEGRGFSKDFSTDADAAFLLNTSAVRAFGWQTAVGKMYTMNSPFGNKTGRVVGMVRDFHLQSFHIPIRPLVLSLNPELARTFLTLKVRSEQGENVLPVIRETLARFSPHYPFEYRWFADIVRDAYQTEDRFLRVFTVATILASIIAASGLAGLASFTVMRRTKEIGIRKVLGASSIEIWRHLSGRFVKSVLVAVGLAWPLGYIIMNRILQFYAYHIPIRIGLFFIAGGFALMLAIVTVSVHSVQATRSNPADSLRYE